MINFFKFIVGTVIGSFISLSSIRSYRHESIIFPASHCDHCNHKLRPWELIPIVSFILLRGKCHQCHRPIGFLTLIGELTGGLIFLFNPLTLNGLLEIIFELLFLFIAECDYSYYTIPTWSLISMLTLTILQLITNGKLDVLTFAIILIIYALISLLNHYLKFIGNGDVDLMFLLFLKTDVTTIIYIIAISSFSAIFKYVIHHKHKLIPYAPYLGFAYLLLRSIKKQRLLIQQSPLIKSYYFLFSLLQYCQQLILRHRLIYQYQQACLPSSEYYGIDAYQYQQELTYQR